MIVAIGDWVLRMSCHELVRLQAMGFPNLRMSVNVSQIQFRHPEFLDKLNAALLDTGINPKCLELEITESVAMEDPSFMLETLHMVRELGISVAIDDFGTGYSSLTYLQRFAIDYIKIDQSFVRNLRAGSTDLALCKALIVLAHELGMKVVAEGVETLQHAATLLHLGCGEKFTPAQGLHLGPHGGLRGPGDDVLPDGILRDAAGLQLHTLVEIACVHACQTL